MHFHAKSAGTKKQKGCYRSSCRKFKMDYQEFFNLTDSPFRQTPDLQYFFPSPGHKDALESLFYGIDAGEGFIQITGMPGTGKTLVLRTLLNRLGADISTALILHPRLSPEELLMAILAELELDADKLGKNSKEKNLRIFRDTLLDKAESGIKTVVIIDEAQDLPDETLEELRLLSNLETGKTKLLQIILVGQPELETKLKKPELKQLYERISIRFSLSPLSLRQMTAYINHRIGIAGGGGSVCFSQAALNRLFRHSRGIPRRINMICERALLSAFIDGLAKIGKEHIEKSIRSISGKNETAKEGIRRIWQSPFLSAAILLLIILSAFGARLFFNSSLTTMAATVKNLTAPIFAKGFGIPEKESALSKSAVCSLNRALENDSGRPPLPPKEAVRIPDGFFLLHLDSTSRDSTAKPDSAGKDAFLFQGGKERVYLKKKFSIIWPLDEGLFILGTDERKRPFIFSGSVYCSQKLQRLTALNLWENIGELKPQKLVPVLVCPLEKRADPAQPMKTGDSEKIGRLISQWADAWRELDIDRYMNFMGRIYTAYDPLNRRPSVFTRQQLFSRKRNLFSKNRAIFLQLSDPLCVINPDDHSRAVAIFYQRYISSVYRDEGIKALYLRRRADLKSADLKNDKAWKITGKLWVKIAESR